MNNKKVLLSSHNINLNHEGKKVLDDISFELRQGEFITLIGPNGAGKSSLIKVLLGLIKPDSGNVTKSNNLKVGYTPQKFSANEFIPITVVDFLTLNNFPFLFIKEVKSTLCFLNPNL